MAVSVKIWRKQLNEALLLFLKAIGAIKCFTRLKKKRTKIHRLRSTATNDIVDENREVNQGHRVELNIRGRGRGTRVAGVRGKLPARRDCIC